jgi:VIT1/CCC1 family predicted Fe2+/Mn2+ transporter
MAIGGVELFFLGFMKSFLIGFPMWKRFFSGFESVILAAIAVAAGFGIGKIFENM